MEDTNFDKIIAKIVENDPRYDNAAYPFVKSSVTYTVKKHNKEGNPEGMRHVTGAEVVEGFCEYALLQFGPLASEVLENWGVRSGPAVGNIVYNMIGMKILSASSEDSQSDFDCCFDLLAHVEELLEKSLKLSGNTDIPVIE